MLTTAQGADLTIAEISEVLPLDRALDRVFIIDGKRTPPTGLRVATHAHHTAHGDREMPVDIFALRKVGDFAAPLCDLGATPQNATAGNWQQSGDRLEQSAFASTIRADQCHA